MAKKQLPSKTKGTGQQPILKDLARQANELHAQVVEHVRTTVHKAKACGMKLIQCREMVEHGGWLDWLDENFTAHRDTASGYMLIARDWHLLENTGFFEGPDLPGVARAIEHIGVAKGRRIPKKKQPTTADDWIKHISGTVRSNIRYWPDEALELFDERGVAIMDSIAVFLVQELGADDPHHDVPPRYAIRRKAQQMPVLQSFANRLQQSKLTDDELAKLARLLDDNPDVLRDAIASHDDGGPAPGN